MLNKILSFLGLGSNQSYVGLSHLIKDTPVMVQPKVVEVPQKELKLSDLIRGN